MNRPRHLPLRFFLASLLACGTLASAVAADDGTWITQSPTGRAGFSTLYDPLRGRLIVFGGTPSAGPVMLNEVWTRTLSGTGSWSKLALTGPFPPGRTEGSAIYDAARDQIVVYGGRSATSALGDTWVLSLATGTWTSIPGSAPPSRYGHSAVHDPNHDRMLIYGGLLGTGGTTSQVWQLDLSLPTPAWTERHPLGGPPTPRMGACTVYDSPRDALVVFAGSTQFGSTAYDDTWKLDLVTDTWSPIATGGPPPPKRNLSSAVYDPVRDAMVVFGGRSGNGSSPNLNDVWSLPLATPTAWNAVSPSGTAPRWRNEHGAIYDARSDRLIVFGGNHGLPYYANDTWSLQFTPAPEWVPLDPDRTGPVMRRNHTVIDDPVRNRMVMFGGWYYDGSTRYTTEVSLLDLADASHPTWSTLFLPAPPTGREGHVAILDPVRDRMIAFGGAMLSAYRFDVWALQLSAPMGWTQLITSGTTPTQPNECSAIYDPVRDRMVIFGGEASGAHTNAVYALSLGATPTWSVLGTTGTKPTARIRHAAIYDPVRDRMLVFGGDPSVSGSTSAETWALDLSTLAWTLLSPAGPPRRADHVCLYDASRDRMLVTGGFEKVGSVPVRKHPDIWALSLADNVWTELHPSGALPGITELGAIFDAPRDRVVAFGGDDDFDANCTGDLRVLSFSTTTGVPPRPPTPLRLGAVRPNPSRAGVVATLELPKGVRAEVRVHDLAGRTLRTLASGVLEAGIHEVRWDGVAATGAHAGPGVYFINAVVDGQRLSRAFVLLH